LDLDLSFGLTGRCQCDHEHCEGEQASDFHGCIIAKAVSPLQVLEISCELRVTSYGQPGSLEARGSAHGSALPHQLRSGAERLAMGQ
jgi:hypothetical protein